MSERGDIAGRIILQVQQSLPSLRPHLRSWIEQHLIHPRRVHLFIDPDANVSKDFWLVTDHSGRDDSTYRIAYDEREEIFGLTVQLETGVEWYMGGYGTFAEAVENM